MWKRVYFHRQESYHIIKNFHQFLLKIIQINIKRFLGQFLLRTNKPLLYRREINNMKDPLNLFNYKNNN